MLDQLQYAAARILVEGGTTAPKVVGFVALVEKAIANGHSLIPCPHCYLAGNMGRLLQQYAVSDGMASVVCEECLHCIAFPADA